MSHRRPHLLPVTHPTSTDAPTAASADGRVALETANKMTKAFFALAGIDTETAELYALDAFATENNAAIKLRDKAIIELNERVARIPNFGSKWMEAFRCTDIAGIRRVPCDSSASQDSAALVQNSEGAIVDLATLNDWSKADALKHLSLTELRQIEEECPVLFSDPLYPPLLIRNLLARYGVTVEGLQTRDRHRLSQTVERVGACTWGSDKYKKESRRLWAAWNSIMRKSADRICQHCLTAKRYTVRSHPIIGDGNMRLCMDCMELYPVAFVTIDEAETYYGFEKDDAELCLGYSPVTGVDRDQFELYFIVDLERYAVGKHGIRVAMHKIRFARRHIRINMEFDGPLLNENW